jgi:hypothetical protein
MGSSTGSNTAQAMIDLLTTKTARDLGLDLQMSKEKK